MKEEIAWREAEKAQLDAEKAQAKAKTEKAHDEAQAIAKANALLSVNNDATCRDLSSHQDRVEGDGDWKGGENMGGSGVGVLSDQLRLHQLHQSYQSHPLNPPCQQDRGNGRDSGSGSGVARKPSPLFADGQMPNHHLQEHLHDSVLEYVEEEEEDALEYVEEEEEEEDKDKGHGEGDRISSSAFVYLGRYEEQEGDGEEEEQELNLPSSSCSSFPSLPDREGLQPTTTSRPNLLTTGGRPNLLSTGARPNLLSTGARPKPLTASDKFDDVVSVVATLVTI